MSCGADILANSLLTTVTAGENFVIPTFPVSGPEFELPGGIDNPLYQQIPKLGIAELTNGLVNGDGAFDNLMTSVKAHLKEEFAAGRIVGAEYSKAYIALVQVAMGNATQFLLGRDQAYWAAVNSQIAAITGKVQLKLAGVELAIAQIRAQNQKAEFALTKLRMANEDAQYCLNLKQIEVQDFNLINILPKQSAQLTIQNDTALFNLGTVLPKQVELNQSQLDTELYNRTVVLPANVAGKTIENATAQYSLTNILPKQMELTQNQLNTGLFNLNTILPKQSEQMTIQNNTAQYTLTNILPRQLLITQNQLDTGVYSLNQMMPAQLRLLDEQKEVQRAQTLDIREDGQFVSGSLGKQKQLYSQQISSYQRSSEINAAKLFTDAWISHKAVDEGIDTPGSFNAANISQVLSSVKNNNGL